jgi:hypothetical protein
MRKLKRKVFVKIIIRWASAVVFTLAIKAGEGQALRPFDIGNLRVIPVPNAASKVQLIPPQKFQPLTVVTQVNTNYGGFREVKPLLPKVNLKK